MKISTKGRYAMRLLIDLNENQGDGFVALKDIAQRQSISKKYLEQIVPALTAEGVLKASRGFQGGYRLAREPEDIPVGEVLRLTEGSISPALHGLPDPPGLAGARTRYQRVSRRREPARCP